MNIRLLGVVPLTTVRLRRILPACPLASCCCGTRTSCSYFALFVKNVSQLRSNCQFSEFNSSLCACLHTGQGVCEVRVEDCTLGWADGGVWLWKALCFLESNRAVLRRRAEAQSQLLQRQGVSSPLDSCPLRGRGLLDNLNFVAI